MEYTYKYESPLGNMTIASDDTAITGLWFDGQSNYAYVLGRHEEKWTPVIEHAILWLNIYFSGEEPTFTPNIRLKGTDFQKEVWQEVLKVPYGRTIAYYHIAKKIIERRGTRFLSAQIIGQAVKRNNIEIIVPCHRVVGADKSLRGFNAGLQVKKALLELEGHKVIEGDDDYYISYSK